MKINGHSTGAASVAPLLLKRQTAETFNGLLQRVGLTHDRDAFIRLFDYFAPRVKSFLMRGDLHETEAEELAQETMLTLWQKAAQFDPLKATASTWIYTIARNKRIDRQRRNAFIAVDIDDLAGQGIEIAAESMPNEWTTGKITDKLSAAIKSLPKEQGELLQKAFFEDMSHAEIAADTHIPLGTIKSRLRQGIARLRQMLFTDNLPGDKS